LWSQSNFTRIPKELCNEISPILSTIFIKSLETGEIPQDWKSAHVAPVYKKGSRTNAENYRPISIPCICSKLLEHVIVSNIMDFSDKNKSLNANQHGFRAKLSCET
jgi:hypothetical protein